MKMVAATGPQNLADQILFEPRSSGLPAGLLASPALVHMVKGTVYIPIVIVGTQCVVLYPNTILGTVSKAHLANSPQPCGGGSRSCSLFTDYQFSAG